MTCANVGSGSLVVNILGMIPLALPWSFPLATVSPPKGGTPKAVN